MPEILFADSFEAYGTGLTTAVQNVMLEGAYLDVGDLGANQSGTLNDGTARTGNHYFQLDSSDGTRLRRGIDQGARRGVAAGIRFGDFDDTDLGISFLGPGGGPWANFQRNTDGTWSFRAGDYNDTVLGTSTISTNANAWHHIEAVLTLAGAAGSYELRIDGEVALSGSAIDFGDGGTGNIASIGLGVRSTAFNFSSTKMDIDDLVIHDGDGFLGQVRVRTYYPDASGSPSDWTVTGAATAHEAVDDTTPDDDTSYIEAANAGDIQVLGIPTLDSEIETIEGVYINERSRQEDAGTTNIRIDILSGVNETQGDARPLTTSYNYGGQAFSLDPNTSGGKFTKTTLEAASIRLTRTA